MKASLKAGLMKYSTVLLGVMMLSCFAQRRDLMPSGGMCESYQLIEGRIACINKIARTGVFVSGFVHHLYQNADELYYVRADTKTDALIKAGFTDPARGISKECALPDEVHHAKITRFIGYSGAALLIADEKGKRTLYRIDFNSGKISQKKGIMDVVLYNGIPVILFKSEKGYGVKRNGIKVPLALNDNPKFGNMYEGRILVIVDGDKKELIDLGIMRNIHGFGSGKDNAENSEDNLFIEALDAVSDKMEALVFYKVYVNGADTGRTDTGSAGQIRKYAVKLPEDEYHIVRLERWELNEGKNTYERANNIYQPQPLKIFLPQHRATKLVFVREKKGYTSSWMTLHK